MLESFILLSIVAGIIHFVQKKQESPKKASHKDFQNLAKALIDSKMPLSNLCLHTGHLSGVNFVNYYKIPVGYGANEPWDGALVVYTGELEPKFYLPTEDNKYISDSAHTNFFAVKNTKYNKRTLTLPYQICKFLPTEDAIYLLLKKKKELTLESAKLEKNYYNSPVADELKNT